MKKGTESGVRFALWGVCFLMAAAAVRGAGQVKETILRDHWKLKSFDSAETVPQNVLESPDGWYGAEVMPAMVHDVLRQHAVIPDPWLPGVADTIQWVSEKDWVYVTTFAADNVSGPVFLQFRGMDGIVDVYLNGVKLAEHANMYVPLEVNVTGRLQTENTLLLHFHTVYTWKDGERSPVRNVDGDPDRPVRRPWQNYLDYLGPHPNFSRVGVYDDVVLVTTSGSRMEETAVRASLDAALSNGQVFVNVKGVTDQADVTVRTGLFDPDGENIAEQSQKIAPGQGRFSAQLRLKTTAPRLWWPRGYGAQPLYRVRTDLLVQGQVCHSVEKQVGFRHVTQSDTLHFMVNGVPVRWWGGCWVSPDWTTVVWNRSRAEQLFEMAAAAHFNAFRVWGVVEAPDDHFYEMADERGFMIWQDFTNMPLSGNARSLAVCREEAPAFVNRLKHHPSVLIWCGNNEGAMWHHQEFNGPLEDRGPWTGPAAVAVLDSILQSLDPERPLFPSSPYYGFDPNDPQHGNTHGYTNMWFIPGYDYLNFASEDTRIACPVLHSMQRFMRPEHIWPADYTPVRTHGNIYPYPESWFRYSTSASWRKVGPVHRFYDAADAASLVYRIGMAAAAYYQETVDRQRRGRDAFDPSDRRRCGGYLVWKYNDSWPEIYSAKVDYFLEPYHTYYTLKRTYAPVYLSLDKDVYVHAWVVNDTRDPIRGTLKIRLLHMLRNEVRKEIVRDVEVAPGKSEVIVRLDEAGIATYHKDHVLYAVLTDPAGQVIAEAFSLADHERFLTFPDAKLDVQVRDGALVITSDQYAHAVHLSGNADGDPFGWFFEDNYFNLFPGEQKVVRILGEHDRGEVTARAWYSPHETSVAWKRQ